MSPVDRLVAPLVPCVSFGHCIGHGFVPWLVPQLYCTSFTKSTVIGLPLFSCSFGSQVDWCVGSLVGPSVCGSFFSVPLCWSVFLLVIQLCCTVGQSDIQSVGTRISQSASQSHIMMLLCMSIFVL